MTLRLLLACAIAESGLDPLAERWGTQTVRARWATSIGDLDTLQEIITDTWPDISFGLAQFNLMYHYLGDGQPTVENAMMVRAAVLGDKRRDVLEMGKRLEACRRQALSVGRNDDLATLVIYNAGHWPSDSSNYWVRYAANVSGYQDAIAQASRLL